MKNVHIFVLFSINIFCCASVSIVKKDAETHCLMISLSENELEDFRQVFSQLHLFLPRYMDSGHKKLRQILSKYGGIDLQVSPKEPLESHILHMQLLLHVKTMEMFERMEKLLGSHKPVNKSRNITEIQDEVNISTLNSQKEYQNSFYETFKLDTKKLGSFSPYALPRDAPYKPTDSHFRPQDCSDILVAGATKSGAYNIYPFKCTCAEPVEVFCDMETDGGGWTVFLARQKSNNQLNFTRNWSDYKNGFGSVHDEYWLGNDALHAMTNSRKYHLAMEAKASEGREVYGEWKTFSVDSEQNKYKITVKDFDTTKGNIHDRLSYYNGMMFTTFDVDLDKNAKNCASLYKGGWWYNNCQYFNPTGLYGIKADEGTLMNPWSKQDSSKRHATWIQIKMRPQICSDTISVASLNTHNCGNSRN